MSTFLVTRSEAGNTVTAVVRNRLGLSWSAARRLVEQGRVRLAGRPCPDPAQRVRAGQRLDVPGQKQSQPLENLKSRRGVFIRFADDHIVVVDKPAGLTTMRHPEEAAEFGPR